MTAITIPAPLWVFKQAKPRPAEYHDPRHATKDSVARHARRYREAIRLLRAEHLPNGAILDCACGTGYGTAMLARAFKGRSIIGVDRNPNALALARAHYLPDDVAFYELAIRHAGAWLVGFRPLAAVVCIETLEHLPADAQEPWITRAYGALEAGGLLVVTCPVRDGGKPVNPWHLHEPTLGELADLMNGTGGEATVYGPEGYISTAGEEAWQATATARRT